MTRSASFLPGLAALAVVLGLGVALPASPARAFGDDEDHVAAREALRRGEILPLSRILTVVQRRVPGDVIDVELERKDGRWRYEVKVLTSTGRVREVKLDARNAAVLEIEDD